MGGAHEWARRASVERTRDRGPAAGLRDEIAGEIRELLALQQELYRDDKPIDVSIAAGVVSLTGEVHPQDDAEILPRMARTVPRCPCASRGAAGDAHERQPLRRTRARAWR